MELNLAMLEKKAIGYALKNDWENALEINKQILAKKPNDLNACIRLGKAQLQTKEFKSAVKTFKKVLEIDPVNTIAIKNLAIAKEGKVQVTNLSAKTLVKEPGTTVETHVQMSRKNLKITIGESLTLSIKKKSVDVINEHDLLLGTIEEKDIVKGLNEAKEEKARIEASLIKEKEGKATILIACSLPVFKAERQDIKPYFKKGTIEEEEPELELSMEENVEE